MVARIFGDPIAARVLVGNIRLMNDPEDDEQDAIENNAVHLSMWRGITYSICHTDGVLATFLNPHANPILEDYCRAALGRLGGHIKAALDVWSDGIGDAAASLVEIGQAAEALGELGEVTQQQPLLAFLRLGGDAIDTVAHDMMAADRRTWLTDEPF